MLDTIIIHMIILFGVVIGLACVFVPFFMDMNERINNKYQEPETESFADLFKEDDDVLEIDTIIRNKE
jgi:hypothetical protein